MKQQNNTRALVLAALTAVMNVGPWHALAETAAGAVQKESAAQAVYASPEAAAQALYDLVKSGDIHRTDQVLGAGSAKLIYTGDAAADGQMRFSFLSRYEQSLKINRVGADRATLLVGDNESPFPFPLVKTASGWQFDVGEGAEELINRRIGENELFVIKFCLAYGDAQREYAEADRDGDRLLEYAQKFRSSDGQHDGLYWPSVAGEPESPFGEMVAQALREGYSTQDAKPISYHGYYYRILTAQGEHARGGAYDYLVDGNMIGGYALIAHPARWGSSGVMTFICNHDGVVYEKNLDAATADAAANIQSFDPDESWRKAD